jgi:hypothetical protein
MRFRQSRGISLALIALQDPDENDRGPCSMATMKFVFIERLLNLERRVCHIYQNLAANESFAAEIRGFWRDMAEDEKQHQLILDRSAGLLNFAAEPPDMPEARIQEIEATVKAAEYACRRPEVTSDEALRHALALESSELNQLDDAWLSSFHPKLTSLSNAMVPAHDIHLQRLADAVARFSTDETLHSQARALL